jgi:aldose 1-epimerase
MSIPPSGGQFEISFEDQRATVVEVGGGIRSFEIAGRDVLDPYRLDAICDGARGAVLIPWPNRLADGHYAFDGEEFALPLTEPATGNAIHGLLRWRNWSAAGHEAHAVTLTIRLHPMPGWPFTLDARVAYTLGPDGLAVETSALNAGERACPFAAGQHPYLSAAGAVDDAVLEFSAAERIVTDERGLPIGREAVAGTSFDFATPRPIGELKLDSAFDGVARDPDGVARVRLTRGDGSAAELWADGSYPLLQLFTGDTLAPDRRRQGLAVEPMTAPPNALASGERLIRLEPGESFTGRWGARLVG